MLPNVPLEPTFRPQRSFSFSMGQDSNFFGYDDYNTNGDMYARSALAPTMEEDEEQHDHFASFDDAYLRARSQSSNAAFGINPSLYWNSSSSRNNIRSSPISNNSNMRRSSLGFVSSSFIPNNSNSSDYINKDFLLPQRRMSQPSLIPATAEYSFPDIPNGPTK
jgi:hypothetical protein